MRVDPSQPISIAEPSGSLFVARLTFGTKREVDPIPPAEDQDHDLNDQTTNEGRQKRSTSKEGVGLRLF